MYYNQITQKYHFNKQDTELLKELAETLSDNSFFTHFNNPIELDFLLKKNNTFHTISEEEVVKTKKIINILTEYYIDYLNKKDFSQMNISDVDYAKFIHTIYEVLSTIHFTMQLGIYPRYIKDFSTTRK